MTATPPQAPLFSDMPAPPGRGIFAYVQPAAPPTPPAPRAPLAYYPDYPPEDGYGGGLAARSGLLLAAAVIVLLVLVLVYVRGPARDPARALARALAQKAWTVYLTVGCSFCQKQMAVLGGAFGNFVLCANGAAIDGYTATPPVACGSIQAFPFWYNTATKEARTGFQDLAALAQMARK